MSTPEVRILAAGSALPGQPVDNAALARRFNMDTSWEQWVDAFIGTRSRHLAVDLESGEVRSSSPSSPPRPDSGRWTPPVCGRTTST